MTRRSGRAIRRTSGITRNGASRTIPSIITIVAPAAPIPTHGLVDVVPNQNFPPITMPGTNRASPISARRRVSARRGAGAPSSARTGEIRPARSAGQAAPARVAIRPVTTAATAAPGENAIAETGIPKDFMASISRTASPAPRASPSAQPASASTNASTRIVRATRRSVAPRARSVPISRIRCSTVMLNELRIRNAPTNSAMPEKK
jgi:hypothetical protein